ncbi:MAG: hypothetical protein LBH37_03545 [Oscillospiraceae bacterium]|jgi:prolyl-tRNA synthetase|nr:hypothetical protein [Oscillospiraceae bacterium]
MKLSKLLGKNLREKPSECFLQSNIFMIRGSYIKNVASGIFSLFLPAKKSIRKIENIIREEMNNINGQEVLFPVVMPATLWEETNRYSTVGNEMIRFKDRNDSNMVLGMTHEEAAVHLAKGVATSYIQYPFMIYQIQTKVRDEPRSRAGLIRAREFTMKDAYSFHVSKNDLEKYYEVCHRAYERIFERVGLREAISIQSDSGVMGGSISHEFMLLSDVGEDKIVICKNCNYKANIEVFVKNNTSLQLNDGLSFEETVEIINGCKCPACESKSIYVSRGIEIGNIFQLGQKYTKDMDMKFVDEKGESKFPYMGCYGIGVGRLYASICEAHNDNYGPIWPISVAPWEVHICALRIDNKDVKEVSEKIYNTLKSDHLDVVFDDRNSSAGEMFADADLLGAPIRIIISARNLNENKVEIITRDKSEKIFAQVDDTLETVKKMISKEYKKLNFND